MQLHYAPGLARLIPSVIASVALVASAATAATESAKVFIAGKSIGNGVSLNAKSGTWLIAPSKLYSYSISATCTGIAPVGAAPGALTLAKIVPPGTSLAGFMESVSPGSSSYLKGKFSNATGTLPAVVLNRKISGSKNVKSVGKVSVSFKLKVSILASGEVVINVTNISITSPLGKIPGTIKFGPGSKATLSTAPLIRFKTTGQNTRETAGSVKVIIVRWGNTNGAAAADYATVNGTATAGDDYIAQKGTVTFASGQREAVINIPITNKTPTDFYREFTVKLSNPRLGAVLGEPISETIGILNN